MLVLQDVDAIITQLTSYFGDHPLSDSDAQLSRIDHLSVESGTKPPYIIVVDIAAIPTMAFGYTEKSCDSSYAIRAIVRPTQDSAWQTIAQEIHDKIYQALHGQKLAITGYANGLALRAGPREPSFQETISSEVLYWHSGRKYFGTTANP